jgi:hypothetical protein
LRTGEQSLKQNGVDDPPEADHAVDGDDRDFEAVAGSEFGVGVYVDGLDAERMAAAGGLESREGLVAAGAARARVDGDGRGGDPISIP